MARHTAKSHKIRKVEILVIQILILQYQVGGMVAFVEAENKRFDTRQTVLGDAESHELVQLLKLI